MENESVIGQYILERKLGEGGMAEVWQARHAHLGNAVAIKFLSARFAGDPELEARFLNEGKRQAQLHHPNLVSATDFIQVDGRSYLVMQFVDGENLEQAIAAKGGPLDLDQIHTISWDVLSVLDYAHLNGVVHRDVKPSNILIDKSGQVFLSDFGIALVLTDERRITRAEMSLGTPDYMSPEQILRPKAVDGRADIYSFGCVLYAMLTGGPPFGVEGATEFYVKDCHVRNSPPPMREINPAISPAVEEVVLKCLEKEPANRFQSCGDVMRALDAAIRGEESELQMAGGAVAYETQADGHMPVRRETSTEQVALADMPPPFSAVQPPPVPPPYQPPPYANNTAPKKGKRGFLLAALAVVALIAAFFGYGYYFLWPEKVLTMEGSTTVGLALAPAMVQSFLKSEGGTDIRLDEGHGAEKNQFKVTARMPGKARRQMYLVIADGSGKAFEALEADKVEIGMSSRPINDKEFQRLSAKGDFRSSACENVIALDGLAIIVNRSNPIRALTRAQIRSIYKGKVTDWSELGGASGPIHMFTRDNESGTFDSFVATVMSGDKSISKAATKKENGEEIADAVAGDPNSIGFVGLAQVAGARALAVSDGTGTAALQPTAFTVATEDYILSRRLFLYTPPKISKETEKFIAFATSDDGQQVVKKTGYVPLQATIEKVTVAGDAPADYRALTAGKHRMQLDFRFRPDSTELDTKALADIGRAASSLANGSTVYLLGFADSQGAASLNRELSQRRAEAVRSKLQELGIRQIEARGLSSEMPVGDNSTPEGRQKNRRVEVWVP